MQSRQGWWDISMLSPKSSLQKIKKSENKLVWTRYPHTGHRDSSMGYGHVCRGEYIRHVAEPIYKSQQGEEEMERYNNKIWHETQGPWTRGCPLSGLMTLNDWARSLQNGYSHSTTAIILVREVRKVRNIIYMEMCYKLDSGLGAV